MTRLRDDIRAGFDRQQAKLGEVGNPSFGLPVRFPRDIHVHHP